MSVLDFEDLRKRNNIKILGRGSQPMLFAHGFGCDQNMWRFVYPEFEEDYKIILFDQVGAGNSDESAYSREKYDSLEGYADDILEICQALDLEDVILVGHSVSAMTGVLAANKDPERFAHLILIGPSPRYLNDEGYIGGFERKDIEELLESLESNYLGWSANMAPAIMGRPDAPEYGEELTNSFCRTNPEIAAHFAEVTFMSDNREDLRELKTPALILQCSQDVLAPPEVGQYMKEQVENNVFYQMKATGHCPNLSAPEETVAAIKEYLQKMEK